MIGLIRGFKTSEFWVLLATILNIVVQQMTGSFEAVAKQVGDQIVMVTPDNVWTAIGAAVAAGLYAIGRGLAKSALLGGTK